MNPFYVIEERNTHECEWDTFTMGVECNNLQVFAIKMLTFLGEDLGAGRYVPPTCYAHLCGEHIIQAWSTLITGVVFDYAEKAGNKS